MFADVLPPIKKQCVTDLHEAQCTASQSCSREAKQNMFTFPYPLLSWPKLNYFACVHVLPAAVYVNATHVRVAFAVSERFTEKNNIYMCI